jgi:hypothetical protein
MTTLPPSVIAQLRTIQSKLNQRTIGSASWPATVNAPVWETTKGTNSK